VGHGEPSVRGKRGLDGGGNVDVHAIRTGLLWQSCVVGYDPP
jgi:hypothetical protein